MKIIPLILTLCFASAFSLSAQVSSHGTTEDFVAHTLSPATVLLYSQDESGGMKMRCTATAIEKLANGYEFATAAHCGCRDSVSKKTVSPEKTFFYITRDEPKDKTFTKVDIVGCGYRHNGDDFMLLDVETTQTFPVVKLGSDPTVLEQVVNVASPLGLGKQVFLGSVSAPKVERPIVQGDINWTGAVLLQMFGVAGGSSGSSVVCLGQQAICAFIVGGSESMVTALPVSHLLDFRRKVKNGEYKYWVKEASDSKESE